MTKELPGCSLGSRSNEEPKPGLSGKDEMTNWYMQKSPLRGSHSCCWAEQRLGYGVKENQANKKWRQLLISSEKMYKNKQQTVFA